MERFVKCNFFFMDGKPLWTVKSRFRRRNGNGKNPDSQGERVDFFAPCAKKYYSALDGLDRRNGDRTGIVFGGEMCYTWVSKLTAIFRLMGERIMKIIEKLNSGDYITIDLFGQEKGVTVFCTGDNRYDENGIYKDDGFALSDEEISCLNWLIQNIKVDDYKQAIVQYCNKLYEGIEGKQIEEADIENEIDIHSIAINVTEVTQSEDGFVYPEISFCGECECDPEHGICIGFRDGKFLGIHLQDWTL